MYNIRDQYDYRDGALYFKTHRLTRFIGQRAGSFAKSGKYRRVLLNGKETFEHQAVWLWHTGTLVKNLDHINGDGTDNRIENLRLADKVIQIANQPARGPSIRKTKSGRYEARLCVNKKRKSLGSFVTYEEAEKVFKYEHVIWYGEYSPFYQEVLRDHS